MAKLSKSIPSGWQEEGSSIQVLEEGQFQRDTTEDTQPDDWQGAGNISHGLATTKYISPTDGAMVIYTDF